MSHSSGHRWSGNAEGSPQTPQCTYEKVTDVSGINGQLAGIAVQPQVLNHNQSRKIIACIIDIICLLICVAIFIFAILVYRVENNVVESYQRELLNTARIVSHLGTTGYSLLTYFLGYDGLPIHLRSDCRPRPSQRS